MMRAASSTLVVGETVTGSPLKIVSSNTILDAAKCMRDGDIGDVFVMDGDRLVGIVTDRDVVVRAVAEQLDPTTTTPSHLQQRLPPLFPFGCWPRRAGYPPRWARNRG